MTPFLFKGAKAICEAIGENPKHIVKLVQTRGVPAWKRDGRGAWRALATDLQVWLILEKKKYITASGTPVSSKASVTSKEPTFSKD